jgi:predicted metal-dependent phosphoesterase TrpH
MPYLIDLHVHTRLGSLDSSIEPAVLVEHARRAGLSGIALTEHYRQWTAWEIERWSTEDVRLYPAAEVSTDLGHLLAFGFPGFPSARTAAELAEEARDCGGALVLAHPFRGFFDSPHHWLNGEGSAAAPPLERAARRSTGVVHGVEVLNNGCTEEENRLADRLRQAIGCPGVAGSDAHLAAHIGRHATPFAVLPRDAGDLAGMLRSGRIGTGRSALTPDPSPRIGRGVPTATSSSSIPIGPLEPSPEAGRSGYSRLPSPRIGRGVGGEGRSHAGR